MKMVVRNFVVLMLFITVIAPIVLYTDRLGQLKSPSTKEEFVEDVTAFAFKGDSGHLHLLPQETSTTLKEPIGIVYADISSETKPSSTDSKVLESREHVSARVLSTTDEEHQTQRLNRIKQVSDGDAQDNHSGASDKAGATRENKNVEDAIAGNDDESERTESDNASDDIDEKMALSTTDEEYQTQRLNRIKQVSDGDAQDNHSGASDKAGATGENKNVEDAIAGNDDESERRESDNASDDIDEKREDQGNETADKVKTETQKSNNQSPSLDAIVRQLKDQLIRARVYLSLPAIRNNPHLTRELRQRTKEVQRSLGDASKDSDLPRNVNEKLRAMEQTLGRARQTQDDCSGTVKKLRAMLHSSEEQLRVHKKQTMFLTQLTAKTLPKGLHCLPLRLTIEYYSLNSSQQQLPNQEKLEDPQLFHYAIFSDNVLATAVVVNSSVTNAKHPSKHVFHVVTDKLNYAAMRMWFLANPPGLATIQVQNIEEFTWLNASYSPVLQQLGSQSVIDYYFRAHRANPDSNLKYRNPKYLSILNHLRFYLPEIFPKLNKVLFLDDDIVVQKDISVLWSIDLKGNVNGAVETCGESFHRFDRYLNFSNPLIAKNFDPHSCGWAYGMNIFDLAEWRRQNITEVYHNWQRLNHYRQLWKLGTLPPGLITFYKRTFPLNRWWHVLGLGYNPNVIQRDIERAAVVHYNGNLKPWLELSIPKYRAYWLKYVDYDHVYLRECNINP